MTGRGSGDPGQVAAIALLSLGRQGQVPYRVCRTRSTVFILKVLSVEGSHYAGFGVILDAHEFTGEIDQLRVESFAGQYPSGTSRDISDERSVYILIRIDGVMAASGRLTPGPDTWLESIYQGKAVMPNGPDVIDFNRAHVHPTLSVGTGMIYLN